MTDTKKPTTLARARVLAKQVTDGTAVYALSSLADQLEAATEARDSAVQSAKYTADLCTQALADLKAVKAELAECQAKLAALEAQEPVAEQFQGTNGEWHNFNNEQHRLNTIEDGSWKIRALFLAAGAREVPPDQEPAQTITPLEEQQMFDEWCPYRGNPDPRTVWAAAIDAANGMLLKQRNKS